MKVGIAKRDINAGETIEVLLCGDEMPQSEAIEFTINPFDLDSEMTLGDVLKYGSKPL